MQKKANIYAPLEGSNEGWIVEIIDENHVNTGLHYMDWPTTASAFESFANESDFFPGEYLLSVYEANRDRPVLRGKVVDGKIKSVLYA